MTDNCRVSRGDVLVHAHATEVRTTVFPVLMIVVDAHGGQPFIRPRSWGLPLVGATDYTRFVRLFKLSSLSSAAQISLI